LLGADDGGTGRKDPMFDRVVTHVVYRRRFGTGEAQASATSVLLQLALRGATDVVVRTAEERGVDVVRVRAEDTSVGSVVARAATWRRTALDLRERVDRRVRRRWASALERLEDRGAAAREPEEAADRRGRAQRLGDGHRDARARDPGRRPARHVLRAVEAVAPVA